MQHLRCIIKPYQKLLVDKRLSVVHQLIHVKGSERFFLKKGSGEETGVETI